jgi:hypothetical protein
MLYKVFYHGILIYMHRLTILMIVRYWKTSSVQDRSASGMHRNSQILCFKHNISPHSCSYRFAHISRTIRALTSSTKTSLRIDDQGLLSLQFLMPAPRSQRVVSTEAFIEFRVCPEHSLCEDYADGYFNIVFAGG